MKYIILVVALAVFAAAMASLAVLKANQGIELSGILEDGATDGDEGYYKLGNDVIIMVNPRSYEFQLIEPLKGKEVQFLLIAK